MIFDHSQPFGNTDNRLSEINNEEADLAAICPPGHKCGIASQLK